MRIPVLGNYKLALSSFIPIAAIPSNRDDSRIHGQYTSALISLECLEYLTLYSPQLFCKKKTA